MPQTCLLPAAQYLRQSTRLQQYSITNQEFVNGDYAAEHGYRIVATYSDGGKSGVVLRNRPALQQLLNDVIAGRGDFEAILVYDVSRWGRFQNTDEAAHYEYICKLAGKPVHYTAEPFTDDRSLPAAIMKTLKRTMAGEFSREQGNRVYRGQKRIAQLGFKVGNAPTFGLRRMLVPLDGSRGLILEAGQHKHLASDRVTLVPGPKREVTAVKRVFELFLKGISISQIAKELNNEKLLYTDFKSWTYDRVRAVLTNPKYTGLSIWGRYSSRLYTPQKLNPVAEWIQVPNAFPAIVDPKTFAKAKRILERRGTKLSDKELLKRLGRLSARHGRLSDSLIRTMKVRGTRMYGVRFGNLENAYRAVGQSYAPTLAQRVRKIGLSTNLRQAVLGQIRSLFASEWQSEVCTKGSRRREIIFKCGRRLSVQVLPVMPGRTPTKWTRKPVNDDCVVSARLFCLATADLDSIAEFYLFPPNLPRPCQFTEERLRRLGGKRLEGIGSLYVELRKIPLRSWGD